MVFCTTLLLLIMVAIHAVLPDVTDAHPLAQKTRSSSRRSSSSIKSRTSDNELEDWDSGQSNLFSNVLLSYNKVKDQEEEEEYKSDDLKSWLSRKFQQLVVASRASSVAEKGEDQEAAESDLEVKLAVPRSPPNSNEIYLPIDFNLLMPNQDNKSSLDANDLMTNDFVELNPTKESPTNEHLFDETAQSPIYLAPSVDDDRRESYFRKQDDNLKDFRNDGTFGYRTGAIPTISSIPTSKPTTQRTPVATMASINGKSTYFPTSSSTPSSTSTTLDYRSISYDLPERRFLMTYPVRRLLMAYFAPRILRFQMAMLLNSVIGEVSRKIIDPFIGSRFGIRTAGSNANLGASTTAAATTSAAPSSSPLSLVQLAQSLSSPLSSLSSLAGIAQQLSGGGTRASPVPAAAAPVAVPAAASPADSSSSALTSLLSSALTGGGGGGGGGISQATINSLLGQLSDSDMKQMLAIAGLGQSAPVPSSAVGGIGGAGVGGMIAAGSAPPVGHTIPSNIDYDEDSSEETDADDGDLMPT